MSIELILLLSLVIAIFLGYKFGVNTGLISIAFAYVMGFFVKVPAVVKGKETIVTLSASKAGTKILIAGWPTKLFFVLLGMTLLFSIARSNKTLELLARKSVKLTKGDTRLIPIVFFIFSTVLAAIGPGNIAVCALVLPIAMAVSSETKINPLLMAAMVIAGSNAGGLSPLAPTGIIAINLGKSAAKVEVGSHIFIQMVIAQLILATFLYLVLGGYKKGESLKFDNDSKQKFNSKQLLTLGVIASVVVLIMGFKFNIGFAAFIGSGILLLFNAADQKDSVAGVPWSTLLLVCGVGVLVNVISKGGGINYLTEALKSVMNTSTSAAILTVIGGLMSSVSSASGVVMPTLFPTAPGLSADLGVSSATLITAITLGAHFVTNSPLSTLGALAVASAGEDTDKTKLFNELLVLGFGGILFGALLVFVGIVG